MSVPNSSNINGNISQADTLRNRSSSTENEINRVPSGTIESARISNEANKASIDGTSLRKEETVPSLKFLQAKENLAARWKRILWKLSVYPVTLGMLASLLMGLNMSWAANAAALALVILDFKDALPSLEKVSCSLLIFFCGMFITVDGFNKTGIPSTLWDLVEPHAKIDHLTGIAILAVGILFPTNVASNVQTVLLLGARVAASPAAISVADEKKAWFILTWVSTIAGNLSLMGSAANLIVCEQGRGTPHLGYTLSFWNHLKFGVPSTLIVTAIGLTMIR